MGDSLKTSRVPNTPDPYAGTDRDVLGPYITISDVTTDDAAITDYKFANKPASAKPIGGARTIELRFWGGDAADKDYTVDLIGWPERGCGMRLMSAAVVTGAHTTSVHPDPDDASSGTYYESDGVTVTEDTVPYESFPQTYHCPVRVDASGFAWLGAVVDCDGGSTTADRAIICMRPVG